MRAFDAYERKRETGVLICQTWEAEHMAEIVTIVKNGQIEIPADLHLPEGAKVRLIWGETDPKFLPYDREELSEEEVRADVDWATGRHFPG
jgi:hypothetical protein